MGLDARNPALVHANNKGDQPVYQHKKSNLLHTKFNILLISVAEKAGLSQKPRRQV